MAPKKSAKKKRAADTRGYSTVSVPSARSLAAEEAHTDSPPAVETTPDIQPATPDIAFEVGEDEIESREEAEHKRHVASEVSYMLKCRSQNAFKGRLYPPLSTDIQIDFNMPNRQLLESLTEFTSGVNSYPPGWACPNWTYDRAARNLHALESAGLSLEVSAEALVKMRGFDERVAFECAVMASPCGQLPHGYCEFYIPASTGGSDAPSTPAAEDARVIRAREIEEAKIRDLQRAKKLVLDSEREEYEMRLPSAQALAEAPPSPTTRYAELQPLQGSLTAAIPLLEKREKKVLESRLKRLRGELTALRPMVDFRRLAAAKAEVEEGASSEENAAAPAGEGADATVDEGGIDLSAVTLEDGGEDEPMFGLFDGTDAAEPAPEESQDLEVFQYVIAKNKSFKTPSQLLGECIKDTKQFRYEQEGISRWVETGEIGPLSAASSRRLGRPKGSFVTATPAMPSRDEASARQLTSLRLLFDITPASDQKRISTLLAPCAVQLWERWVEDTLSASERALHAAAELRARAAEASLPEAPGATPAVSSFPDCAADDGVRGWQRAGQTVTSIAGEIAERARLSRFPLEEVRAALPALRHAEHLVVTIQSHDVTIIAGDTGSGKSTQVPQLLLRACGDGLSAAPDSSIINIIVTEPRRVAAISVSDRVRAELGDSTQNTALCGYTVRLDSNVGPRCVLEYVTIGVLLRRIQATKGQCLSAYSHCIVDEVHERSVDSDLLLLLLREYKTSFKNTDTCGEASPLPFPRVVLMSATADMEAISAYWRAATQSIGYAAIEGRTFPVDAFFLEETIELTGYRIDDSASEYSKQPPEDALDCYDVSDCSPRTRTVLSQLDPTEISYDIIASVLKYEISRASPSACGAIIVFMPGLEEIKRVLAIIESDDELFRKCVPVPMHSSLSSEDLQRAFRKVDPRKRKCVVSTNICETGVTIEDVDLVIDLGFVKSVVWNEVTETSRLRMHMCSIAEATQRRGRAGRVRPGRCVHLFSKRKMHPDFEGEKGRMRSRPEPEMKRAPLTAPILSLTDQGLGAAALLDSPGDTVSLAKLTNALKTLLELGALVDVGAAGEADETTRLDSDDAGVLSRQYAPTPLGRALAVLPCDPRSGKVLLAANQLGCLEAAVVFIASLDTKSLFNRNLQPDVFFKGKFGKRSESDAVTIVNAYSEWMTADKLGMSKYRWCHQHAVSVPAMMQLSGVARDLLRSVRSVSSVRSGALLDEGEVEELAATKTDRSGSPPVSCLTCKTQVGLHCCVTRGSKEALHAAITTGMGNNVSYRTTPAGADTPRFLSGNKSNVHCRVHRSSFASNPGDYIVYCNQMVGQSGMQSLLNVVSIDVMTLVLFSPWSKVYYGEGTVIIGRGIGVKFRQKTLAALRRLRAEWERVLVGNEPVRGTGGETPLMAVLQQLVHHSPLYF